MRRRFVLAIVVAAGVFGCGGHLGSATSGDAAPTADDGGPICPGTLPDGAQGIMLISSLFDLSPLVACGDFPPFTSVAQESASCAGSIQVSIRAGNESIEWWLFDAKTGDLEAVGETPAYTDDISGCVAARPGFVFPTQCIKPQFFSGGMALCQDAGAQATADATFDITPDGSVCTSHGGQCVLPYQGQFYCPAGTYAELNWSCGDNLCCYPGDAGDGGDPD
jgi:hypothetical protein